jgi:hypothetical protein
MIYICTFNPVDFKTDLTECIDLWTKKLLNECELKVKLNIHEVEKIRNLIDGLTLLIAHQPSFVGGIIYLIYVLVIEFGIKSLLAETDMAAKIFDVSVMPSDEYEYK